MLPIRRSGVLAIALALVLETAAAQPIPAALQPGQGGMQISALSLTILIRSTVLALHQANLTGNYSVLRDLGTPVFRETFDQSRLTDAFANLRRRKIDLSPALVVTPNLTKNPELNQNKELVLVGDFPTQPLTIHFEFAFLQLDGYWRLAGLAVDAVPAAAREGQASAEFPAKPVTATQDGRKKPAKSN
jgi:hypothetical protein